MNVLMLSEEKVSMNKPADKGVGHLCGNESHSSFVGWICDQNVTCDKSLQIVHSC